jgi:hypothetical protein
MLWGFLGGNCAEKDAWRIRGNPPDPRLPVDEEARDWTEKTSFRSSEHRGNRSHSQAARGNRLALSRSKVPYGFI